MMNGWVVFSYIIAIFCFAFSPICSKLFLVFLHLSQWKRMSVALVRFGWIVCLTNLSDVVLSVCIGVVGC